MTEKKYGGIMPKGALYLTVHIGTALDPDTEKPAYQLATLPDMSPVVQCEATGKRWHINWKRLIELAKDEDVDVPWGEEEPTNDAAVS